MRNWKILLSALWLAYSQFFPVTVFAKGAVDLDQATRTVSINVVYAAGLLLLLLLASAGLRQELSEQAKRLHFWAIVVVVTLASLVLIGGTIRLNLASWSKGPVHWHADYEVWACGHQLDLVDPMGRFSNKVGTPSRHEHNDGRLHYEGVVVNHSDAALTDFFSALGQHLTSTSLVLLTNERLYRYTDGDQCANGMEGDVQVFVYHTNPDHTFSQSKVAPETYTLSPDSQVPPGDCIIVEVDQTKEKTDKLCRSYVVAQEIGKLTRELP